MYKNEAETTLQPIGISRRGVPGIAHHAGVVRHVRRSTDEVVVHAHVVVVQRVSEHVGVLARTVTRTQRALGLALLNVHKICKRVSVTWHCITNKCGSARTLAPEDLQAVHFATRALNLFALSLGQHCLVLSNDTCQMWYWTERLLGLTRVPNSTNANRRLLLQVSDLTSPYLMKVCSRKG